jgi:hypothetical protein
MGRAVPTSALITGTWGFQGVVENESVWGALHGARCLADVDRAKVAQDSRRVAVMTRGCLAWS